MGFSSGLPLALTGGTLQAWLTVENVDIETIGLFSLVGIPYTLKFFWSPFMDRFVPPFLGRRRGWLLITQLGILGLILGLSSSSPASLPLFVAILALSLALFSASQDIVFDAYRTDILASHERGLGAAVSVTGYRIAMLVSGAFALVISTSLGWRATYLIMAMFMGVGILATLISKEPQEIAKPPTDLQAAIKEPFKEFFTRPVNGPRLAMVWMLVLIILYKLGDAFAGSLTTAFLIRGAEFSVAEVGVINKGMGLGATLLGALCGGTLMARMGLFRSLMVYGIFQAVSNLTFMVLAMVGKNYALMVFAIAFENLSGGMGTAAFVAFLMALCNHRYTATQFALLSAFASLGRVFVGPPSGYLVEHFGWVTFFLMTFLVALPGLLLLAWMKNTVQTLDTELSRVEEKQ